MPTIVQFRRGTEAQSDAFTGNVGELSVDTTNETVRVHDGSTAGGSRLATYAEVADRMQVANVQSLVTSSINNVLDSAPGTLDTLNELAAAIGDDADFLSKVQANIDQKLGATASVTLTGDVTGSGSFSSNAVSITLTDTNLGNTNAYIAGVQSNLNATNANVDQKLGATASVTLSGDVTGTASFSSNAVSITTTIADDSHNHVISNVDGLQNELDSKIEVANAIATFSTLTQLGNTNSYIAGVQSNLDATNANVDQKLGATSSVTLTGAVTGTANFSANAVSITTTATSDPTITLGGDLTGSVTLTNLGDGTLTAAVVDDSHNHSSSSGAFTVGTDLTVSGGDIILSGTGRIQGIDTVSAGTDAANKTYVDTAVANIVDTAPEALNTLNELAAALGDDANFATTTATSLGTKAANTYVNSTFQTIAIERAALANTNAYIATKQATITGGATTITSSNLTASRALVSDGSGKVGVSDVTSTEIGYLDGVTSAIQTQLNAKQATITGAATTIDTENLTVSRALVSDGSGKVAVSAVTSTEIGYLDGVTSAIQTQLNAKQATITGAATTIDTENLTVSRALVSDGSGKVGVSAVTSTELGYLDGVTSAIQTQLNAKGVGSITGVTAGSGLTGGGASGSVTLNVGAGSYITVAADTVAVDATTTSTASKVVARDGSGNFAANIITAVDFNATSDQTMKTNVTTIESSLEKLDAIRGVNFNWKKDARYAMGVIAQEVEEVIPEVVSIDGEGLRSVNYGALVGLLIEAVKDLKNEVEELKRK